MRSWGRYRYATERVQPGCNEGLGDEQLHHHEKVAFHFTCLTPSMPNVYLEIEAHTLECLETWLGSGKMGVSGMSCGKSDYKCSPTRPSPLGCSRYSWRQVGSA